MNFAFQAEPFNPHVHRHIFPRYRKTPIFAGINFDDPLFGYFYDDKTERIVSDEVITAITEKLKSNID
jgi:diadenosine tetraphosphate (Ap4A) HIT family hydrolase